jgi:hypothetical protein
MTISKNDSQFCINMWDMRGARIIDHIVDIENYEGAETLYRASVERWPTCRVILQDGERIVRDSG